MKFRKREQDKVFEDIMGKKFQSNDRHQATDSGKLDNIKGDKYPNKQ